MSKIKVDTIESRNGTLTVGAANDTVNYAAGSIPNASLENSAITINGSSVSLGGSVDVGGAIDWQTTAKTTAFTAVAGEGYFVDTSSGAITATLPASPSGGDQVAFKDYATTFATNNLTIARNGSNIQGISNDATIETNRASVILVYVDATKGWLFTAESNVNLLAANPPDAPTIGTATATGVSGTVTVSYTAPADDGGATITQYTATSSPDGITGTLAQAGSGTITVTGLTNGQAYTFTVTATNEAGTSDPSVASNSATPFFQAYVAATGGTITTVGDFKIHTFNSSGTFTVTDAGNSSGSNTVDYLVLAGGASGGQNVGGGGGAGGYRESFPNPATGGLPVSAQAYPITVGAGGAANSVTRSHGNDGSNSVFSSITSSGGGGGGGHPALGGGNQNGRSGGSGGGGGSDSGAGIGPGGTGNSPSVSPPQGNPGGPALNQNDGTGGGGGGAGGPGNPPSNPAGGGGVTVSSSITGSAVSRAGGGGGAKGTPGTPGTPGANKGFGGAGQRDNPGAPAGDSGVVIIRYKFQ